MKEIDRQVVFDFSLEIVKKKLTGHLHISFLWREIILLSGSGSLSQLHTPKVNVESIRLPTNAYFWTVGGRGSKQRT